MVETLDKLLSLIISWIRLAFCLPVFFFKIFCLKFDLTDKLLKLERSFIDNRICIGQFSPRISNIYWLRCSWWCNDVASRWFHGSGKVTSSFMKPVKNCLQHHWNHFGGKIPELESKHRLSLLKEWKKKKLEICSDDCIYYSLF